MPVTKPTELTVTNVWLVSELVQVAKPVTSWVVPSLKLAVAVKFTDVPTWTGAGFGVMAIEVNVGFTKNPLHPLERPSMETTANAAIRDAFRPVFSMINAPKRITPKPLSGAAYKL